MTLKVKLTKALVESKTPEAIKESPPSVVGMIDDVLTRKTEPVGFFRPSMLGGCDRANVFHYMRAPSEPQKHDPRFMRILDNGTAIHEVLQGYLADHHEWWFAPESRIFVNVEGAWVRGSCDGVLIRRSDQYRFGVEFKTMGHDEFMRLSKPKDGHVFQASLYARLQKLYWIVIVYWDKDKQHLKEFPVKYDPQLWADTQARVRELKGYVDRRELPQYNPSTCDKTFCSYVEQCRRKGAPV